MGTDIHGVFQAKNESGAWVDVQTGYERERHYQLFAVLADVRNGYGFAGVRTGEALTPIAPPRGLPDDVSNEDDRFGDHSFSWLSGAEMLAWFDHAPTVRACGVLRREQYEVWDKKSEPSDWCGMIWGRGVEVVDLDAIDRSDTWTHVRVEWDRDLKDDLSYFFAEVRRLVDLHGEIRFVFGFDS